MEVRLAVYDKLGRNARSLIDEYKQASIHKVTFNDTGLSSGVYFYRPQAGDQVEMKRMLLLK